jgi:MarR family transcriptional regulator, lower aerobic nicotinate degradation pathway regulator
MDGVRRLVRLLRSANTESERRTGVTTAQLFVLKHIAQCPDASVSDVAARTLTTQSTASEVVSRLVERGLVSRVSVENDRRRVALRATEKGQTVLRVSSPPVQEHLIAALGQLPTIQQEAIARGLTAWLNAAGFSDVAPSMFFEPETGGVLTSKETNHVMKIPFPHRLIEPGATVNEVLLRHPELAPVFKTYSIDTCCGGAVALESVARRHGIDIEALLTALENGVKPAGETQAAS